MAEDKVSSYDETGSELAQSASANTRDKDQLLFSRAIDIHLARFDLQKSAVADLSGVVSHRWRRGNTRFLRLHDATGEILLRYRRPYNREARLLWKQLSEVILNDHVRVTGRISITQREVRCIDIVTVEVLLHPPASKVITFSPAASSRMSAQHLLARIRTRVQLALTADGFVEYEPTFLSVSALSPTRETLRVVFPGLGSRGYLTVSPARQLIDAIFNTGSNRVFSVSHQFLPVAHDAYTSYEGVIVSVVQLGATIKDLYHLAEQTLKSTLDEYITARSTTCEWSQQDWPVTRYLWLEDNNPVTFPEIRVRTIENQGLLGTDFEAHTFQIFWPPNHIVAEGHVESMDGQTQLGGLTIHLQLATMLLIEEILDS